MSKNRLNKYLQSLDKRELQAQIMDLYLRFAEVKTFYDFAFNPQEDKLLHDAKAKVYKEYFPEGRRKAKARRSVAQNIVKHFKRLEIDPAMLADFMLYNLETAFKFAEAKSPRQEAFYKSMLRSYREVLAYCSAQGLMPEMNHRISSLKQRAYDNNWYNAASFAAALQEWRERSGIAPL